LFHYVVGKGG